MGAGRRHVPVLEVRKRHVFSTNYHLAAEWDPHGHCLLSSCPKPGTVTPAPVTSNKGLGWVSNPGASLKRVAFSSQVRGQGRVLPEFQAQCGVLGPACPTLLPRDRMAPAAGCVSVPEEPAVPSSWLAGLCPVPPQKANCPQTKPWAQEVWIAFHPSPSLRALTTIIELSLYLCYANHAIALLSNPHIRPRREGGSTAIAILQMKNLRLSMLSNSP